VSLSVHKRSCKINTLLFHQYSSAAAAAAAAAAAVARLFRDSFYYYMKMPGHGCGILGGIMMA